MKDVGASGYNEELGGLVDPFVLVARYDDVLGILHQGFGGHVDEPVFVRNGASKQSGVDQDADHDGQDREG